MTQQKFVVLGALAALSLPGFAGAQNPQPAPPGQAHTLAPPNSPSPPPEQIRPANPKDSAEGSQTLSDKLSQQRGTLQPPAIEPRHPQVATAAGRGQHAGDPTAGLAWRQPTGGPEVVPLCARRPWLWLVQLAHP